MSNMYANFCKCAYKWYYLNLALLISDNTLEDKQSSRKKTMTIQIVPRLVTFVLDMTHGVQELLTRHKILCAEFLESNYDNVFTTHYQGLLHSENYVTRRQALKVTCLPRLDEHTSSLSHLTSEQECRM